MRAFIAAEIPENLKDKILDIQKRFKDFDIKFVEKENLHFNLKFLGETKESKVNKIKIALENIAKQFEPFEIDISGLGAFPSRTYVRVIWLGVKEGYQQLLALAQSVENALSELGFEKEERKFQPHLTLGRVRSGRNKDELAALLQSLENIEIGKMEIREIKFFESRLSPKGPVYSAVFAINFK